MGLWIAFYLSEQLTQSELQNKKLLNADQVMKYRTTWTAVPFKCLSTQYAESRWGTRGLLISWLSVWVEKHKPSVSQVKQASDQLWELGSLNNSPSLLLSFIAWKLD